MLAYVTLQRPSKAGVLLQTREDHRHQIIVSIIVLRLAGTRISVLSLYANVSPFMGGSRSDHEPYGNLILGMNLKRIPYRWRTTC